MVNQVLNASLANEVKFEHSKSILKVHQRAGQSWKHAISWKLASHKVNDFLLVPVFTQVCFLVHFALEILNLIKVFFFVLAKGFFCRLHFPFRMKKWQEMLISKTINIRNVGALQTVVNLVMQIFKVFFSQQKISYETFRVEMMMQAIVIYVYIREMLRSKITRQMSHANVFGCLKKSFILNYYKHQKQ